MVSVISCSRFVMKASVSPLAFSPTVRSFGFRMLCYTFEPFLDKLCRWLYTIILIINIHVKSQLGPRCITNNRVYNNKGLLFFVPIGASFFLVISCLPLVSPSFFRFSCAFIKKDQLSKRSLSSNGFYHYNHC